MAAFMLGGLAAPWLAPHNPAAIDLLHRLEGPSAAHWAGTDELGRDTLSRLLWGARLSLAVSVSVVTISLALGLAIGGLAGYLGGWIDTALTTFAMNTFLALPGILLAIAFAAFLGPRLLQSCPGPGYRRMGRICAPGKSAGHGRPRPRICGCRPCSRRRRASHLFPTHPAQYRAAHPGAGRHRHGRSDPGRSHSVVPGPGDSGARAKLGRHAQRCAGCTCSTRPTWCSSLPPLWPEPCSASTSWAMPCAISLTPVPGWKWGSR